VGGVDEVKGDGGLMNLRTGEISLRWWNLFRRAFFFSGRELVGRGL